VKKIRLLMWVVTVVAAMAASSVFALPQSEAAVRARDDPLEVDRTHLHPRPYQDHEYVTGERT
jgi:hypothetical protein